MKSVVYILGVIGGMALVLGFFLEGLGWTGANIVTGFAKFVLLLFFPLVAIYLYRKDPE